MTRRWTTRRWTTRRWTTRRWTTRRWTTRRWTTRRWTTRRYQLAAGRLAAVNFNYFLYLFDSTGGLAGDINRQVWCTKFRHVYAIISRILHIYTTVYSFGSLY